MSDDDKKEMYENVDDIKKVRQQELIERAKKEAEIKRRADDLPVFKLIHKIIKEKSDNRRRKTGYNHLKPHLPGLAFFFL